MIVEYIISSCYYRLYSILYYVILYYRPPPAEGRGVQVLRRGDDSVGNRASN